MSSKTTESIDDAIFDDRAEFYQGLAYGYLKNFIENTDRETLLAYKLCSHIESNLIGQGELSSSFPKKRRNYKRRYNQVKKVRSPLEKEKRELRKQVQTLEDTRLELKEKKQKVPVTLTRKIEASHRGISELDARLSEKKIPRGYHPHYKLHEEKKSSRNVSAEDWRYLQQWFEKREAEFASFPKAPLFDNLFMLCDHLNLKDDHKALLAVLLCYEKVPAFKRFIDVLSNEKVKGFHAIIGKMVGVDTTHVSHMLLDSGDLKAKALIDIEAEDHLFPKIDEGLVNVLSEEGASFEQICNTIIGEPVTTNLDWDKDFSHLGDAGNELIRLLEGAKKDRQEGLNFLLYGIQDAGKTEAVKAACQKVGITLYAVGEGIGRGISSDEPSRQDRISHAVLAQSLLSDQENAAILFDEMEDALPQSGLFASHDNSSSGSASKIYLNRMLERNQTLTFWTANDVEKFHPAVRRRMRFSLQFRIPPASVRENMWKTISAKQEFNLANDDCARLGRNYMAPPGMITTAVKNAKMGNGGGVEAIETSLRASASIVFGSHRQIEMRNQLPDYYDPNLINAKLDDQAFDINALTDGLVCSEHRDFSMLLYGPPGTGKSANIRYLANALGMEVLFKRASDIMGMYVGENEKNIAEVFAQAEEQNLFLIIDEADTFLQNRENASRGWEVSMVNEMLTWLEHHPLPVAFTTNLTDNLDAASKRRFVFKIKCDYMRPDQAEYAFRVFFKQDPPQGLERLDMLTPGDFATVQKQSKFKHKNASAEALLDMLRHEIAMKNERPNRPIGFVTSKDPVVPQARVAASSEPSHD